jgi:uncharacterized delta-60 repeat protein
VTSFGPVYPALDNIGNTKDLVLPDGKILVGATVWLGGTVSPQLPAPPQADQVFINLRESAIELMRFNADGSVDTTFGNEGVVVFHPDLADFFSNFALQPDGAVVVVGTKVASPAAYLVPAYSYTVYTDIGPGGPRPHQREMCDVVWKAVGMVVARFDEDGTPDPSFHAAPLPDELAFQMSGFAGPRGVAVAVRADGKIVVAGQEVTYGSSPLEVVRYNPDGSLDTTFYPAGPQPGVVTTRFDGGTIPFPILSENDFSGVAGVAVQADGKIVVGACEPQAGAGFDLLRFNADGTVDTTFGSGGTVTRPADDGGSPPILTGLAVQPDGKILAVGYVYVGPQAFMSGGLLLTRFNADGSPDQSFGQQGTVWTGTASEPLGVFGVHQLYGSEGGGALAYDTFGWAGLYATSGFVLEPDGTIVVAGTGVAQNLTWRVGNQWFLARFNPDGSRDAAFGQDGVELTPFPGHEAAPWAIALDPDGSLVVPGFVASFPFGFTGPFPDAIGFVIARYRDATTDPPTPAPPPAGTAPAPQPATPSDAAFATLAAEGAAFQAFAADPDNQRPAPTPPASAGDPSVPPTHAPALPAPLPVATPSQSQTVARLSGGGGGTTATDDPLGLTGEPDAVPGLALAADEGPAGPPPASS